MNLRWIFRTRYRVIYQSGVYKVQEHCWYDLFYGWWWHVDNAPTLEQAKEIIKNKEKPKATVAYSA